MNQETNVPSFVPKKADAKQVQARELRIHHIIQLLTALSAIVFLVGVGSAVGSYMYRSYLESSLQQRKAELEAIRDTFQPKVVDDLAAFDTRLEVSQKLLADHVAVTPFFDELGKFTLQTISYTSLSLARTERETVVTASGIATGFEAIALQSDAFAESRLLLNPVFSSFVETDGGSVLFTLSMNVDPELFNYQNTLES